MFSEDREVSHAGFQSTPFHDDDDQHLVQHFIPTDRETDISLQKQNNVRSDKIRIRISLNTAKTK